MRQCERQRLGVVVPVDDNGHVDVLRRPWFDVRAHCEAAEQRKPPSELIEVAHDVAERGLESSHAGFRCRKTTGIPSASPCSAPGRS